MEALASRLPLEGFKLGALGKGMVKEHQCRIFLDSRPFASERVPLFWI